MSIDSQTAKPAFDPTRYTVLPKMLKVLFVILSAAGIAVGIYYIFGLSSMGAMLNISYYYLLMAIYCPCSFLILPRFRGDKRVPWYDILFAALSFGIAFYFFVKGYDIRTAGWVPATPLNASLAFILLLLILEGGRRTGGIPYLIICLLIGGYGFISKHMPGVLYGFSRPFDETIALYVFGSEGIAGIPSMVVGNILIGFLFFAGMLIASGAGRFMLQLAYAIAGRFRGGPAKVAVLASAFMGTLSGSAPANVVSTGSVTIPAMKRLGYSPERAGAIETCASIGGLLTPPVMGAVIFVMAVIINTPYADIMVAVTVPAVLYYFSLMMQVDSYSAKVGIRRLPPEETPPIIETLKDGWHFIIVIAFLVWGLLYMRWAEITPFYASGLLFLLSFTSKKTMMTPKRFTEVLVSVGKLIAMTMAILLPMGIIIAPLVITGVAAALAGTIISVIGDNIIVLLLVGAAVCFILGLIGMLTPAYVFLAITLAPVLVQAGGLNLLAVHLFIIYAAALSGITPPVAVIAFIGAGIAGASPMKTALESMRFGAILYFIPFFFVYEPSLVLAGPMLNTIYFFTFCVIGISFIAGGLQGYLWAIGEIKWVTRIVIIAAGTLIAIPESITTIMGVSIAVIVVSMLVLMKRRKANEYKAETSVQVV